MNIQPNSESTQLVEELIASGKFESAEAVVAAGIQLLKGQQQLHADIQQAIDELDAGQGIEGEVVFNELREHARRSAESAGS